MTVNKIQFKMGITTYLKKRIKKIARNILAQFYYSTGRYKNKHKGKLLILTYHRVLPERDLKKTYVQPAMYVELTVFEEQIQFLKSVYRIISFQEYLDLKKRKNLDHSQQYCIITFDDGWRDNYDYAFSILNKYAVPATIFLTTSYIDSYQWFWPERIVRLFSQDDVYGQDGVISILLKILKEKRQTESAIRFLSDITSKNIYHSIDAYIDLLKRIPSSQLFEIIDQSEKKLGIKQTNNRLMLTWDEVEQMAAQNISFGSHGCRHHILSLLPENEMRYEISESLEALKNRKINYVPIFCYPNGNFTPAIANYVASAGYESAVSSLFGVNNIDSGQSFSMKRIGIHNDICSNLQLFSLRISGLLEGLRL